MSNLIAFPLYRRWSLVSETVVLLQRKEAQAATRFWQMTVRRLRGELQTCSIDQEIIERELEEFASVVMSALESSSITTGAMQHENATQIGGADNGKGIRDC